MRVHAVTILASVVLGACAVGPTGSAPDARDRRVAAQTADAMRLQSELLALADTALARTTAETQPGTLSKDPQVRAFSLNTRLTLGTALVGIVTGPDPVDALLDMLTHTTLTADAMRNEAQGKAPDSPQARLLKALEQNEADAWKLAERWVDAPTRAALRERILSWPGERKTAAAVAYVRLSDVPRSGSASAEAGEGVVSSLRAAVKQAEQARLLAERGLFLAQRTPYTLRWQAEVFTHNTLTTDESRRLLDSISGLTATADSAVREVAGMPAQLSQERVAALQDLFARFERERTLALRQLLAGIELERRGTLEQMALIVQRERSATLAEAAETLSTQRKAIIGDLTEMAARAEMRGREWGTALLLIGAVAVIALLLALFGMLLIYRRFLQRMERHPPR